MKQPDDSAAPEIHLDNLSIRLDAVEKLRRTIRDLEAGKAAAVAAASDPFDKKLAPKLKLLAAEEKRILDFAEENMNEVFPGEARKFASALSGLTCRAMPPSVACDNDDEDEAIANLELTGLADYVRTKKSLDKAKLKSALIAADGDHDDAPAILSCGISLKDDEWKVDFLKK